jgi:hypothetical protein
MRCSQLRRAAVAGACVTLWAALVPAAHAAQRAPSDVSVMQPVRVLDTRTGTGAIAHPLVPGAPLHLALPTTAASVIFNLTAVNATGYGWVRVWSCDQPEPTTSALNVSPGRAAANAVVVQNSNQGTCFDSSVAVDLIADLSGSFSGGLDFTATSPNRVLDTRVTNTPLRANQERSLIIGSTSGMSPIATVRRCISVWPTDQRVDRQLSRR